MLKDFQKGTKRVIRCANKNRQADIKIDGKGNLMLISNNFPNRIIKLVNVFAAENISENLLSLRKFVDAGLGIYLDDEILEIIDKQNKDVILSVKYLLQNNSKL